MVHETHNNSSKTTNKIKNKGQSIKVADIDIAIQMLKTYLDTQDISPLLAALETLTTEPQNEAYQLQVINAFNDLGAMQGAVLTYAPYLNIFVSDDPFGDDLLFFDDLKWYLYFLTIAYSWIKPLATLVVWSLIQGVSIAAAAEFVNEVRMLH